MKPISWPSIRLPKLNVTSIRLPELRLPEISLPHFRFPDLPRHLPHHDFPRRKHHRHGHNYGGHRRRNRRMLLLIGLAVMIIALGVALWYRKRKARGYLPGGNPRENQPSRHLRYIYPHAYQSEQALDKLDPSKFPVFQLNEGEFFIWDSLLPSKEFGQALLQRGVTHVNAAKGKDVGWTVPQGRRFGIMYRPAFQEFTASNLAANQQAIAAFTSQFSPGAVDVLCLDLENEQPTDTYGSHARALSAYARTELGVKYVDFLGMQLVNIDFNVSGQPLSDTFFARYLRDVITYDDPLPYIQNAWLDTGDWLYSLVNVTERARMGDPGLPQVSFFWNRTVDGRMFIPEHVAHAYPLFILFCGGKGLIAWHDNKPGVSYAAHEALIAGFHRASQHNDIRRGRPEFLTPEISLDGGKTWHPNDAATAKISRHPIVRICRNGAAHVVVGCNSIPGAQPVEVMFRCTSLTDTIRLEARKTYLGKI